MRTVACWGWRPTCWDRLSAGSFRSWIVGIRPVASFRVTISDTGRVMVMTGRESRSVDACSFLRTLPPVRDHFPLAIHGLFPAPVLG